MPLFLDPEAGVPVSTHSSLKTFRRCPKQAQFKYKMRLKPRILAQPLKRGTWIHKLLEVHCQGGNWQEEHKRLSVKFEELFDEEKDEYGDLPREIATIMRGYMWHYKNYEWKVLDTEFVLEAELPDGAIFRCKVDALVEDQFGLWIVDHKSHKRLPTLDYRILDAQSADYIWCALKNKIPVQGHIWNYIKWKAPTKPQLLKSGSRLSVRKIETDYPTFAKAIKEYDLNPRDYAQQLAHLKGRQYAPGEPQTSPFFLRQVLEKSPAMLNQVAREMYHTHKRMQSYDWDTPELIERVPDTSCKFTCAYTDICAIELWGGNIKPLIKQKYVVGDPLDYYHDQDGDEYKKSGAD